MDTKTNFRSSCCNPPILGVTSEVLVQKGVLMNLVIQYNSHRLGIFLPFWTSISKGFIGKVPGHFHF